MKTTTIAKLRVGQRYQEIPKSWYGPAKLIYKKLTIEYIWNFERQKMEKQYRYDLKFDAAVVNPPGIQYGVLGKTRVQLLAKEKNKCKTAAQLVTDGRKILEKAIKK